MREQERGPLPVTREQLEALLTGMTKEQEEALFAKSRERAIREFGRGIYLRGLLEISSYCKNNCYYCGIRAGNREITRYRMSREEVLDSCRKGEKAGFRTFVLQGGEDPGLSVSWVEETVGEIRRKFPHCAITLSLGEQERGAYERWKKAGADRYLLRHETADPVHYQRLHPPVQSFEKRRECLYALKELGYQTGSGMMVGSPGQGPEQLYQDLLFLWELQPEMIGIGPYLPHHQTPFSGEAPGSLQTTLRLLALLRLLFPRALLPATTALVTLHPRGRLLGILAGANVVMPNISPTGNREKYTLYDGKAQSGAEAMEGLEVLNAELGQIGYVPSMERGDYHV